MLAFFLFIFGEKVELEFLGIDICFVIGFIKEVFVELLWVCVCECLFGEKVYGFYEILERGVN